jgi:hypothetical protein
MQRPLAENCPVAGSPARIFVFWIALGFSRGLRCCLGPPPTCVPRARTHRACTSTTLVRHRPCAPSTPLTTPDFCTRFCRCQVGGNAVRAMLVADVVKDVAVADAFELLPLCFTRWATQLHQQSIPAPSGGCGAAGPAVVSQVKDGGGSTSKGQLNLAAFPRTEELVHLVRMSSVVATETPLMASRLPACCRWNRRANCSSAACSCLLLAAPASTCSGPAAPRLRRCCTSMLGACGWSWCSTSPTARARAPSRRASASRAAGAGACSSCRRTAGPGSRASWRRRPAW